MNYAQFLNVTCYLTLGIFGIQEAKSQKVVDEKQSCHVVNERLDSNRIGRFLETNTSNQIMSQYFLNDTASVCLLWWTRDTVLILEIVDGSLFSVNDEVRVHLHNNEVEHAMISLSEMKTVYRMECDQDFMIMDYGVGFMGCWVKKKGEIAFVFYSTKCDFSCLTKDSQKVISDLLKIERNITTSKSR